MTLARIVKDVCNDLDVSISELARRMKQSPQNLGKKLNNETLNFAEFQKALEILGVRYDHSMTYPGEESPRVEATEMEKFASAEAEFFSNISHEVRTSLNAITGCTDLALKHNSDAARVNDYLKKIKVAANQLNSYISVMLDLSRAEIKKEDILLPVTESVNPELFAGKKVLIVDDNDLNRDITKDILQDNGFEVEEAVDGIQAVNMVDKKAPGYYDVILMDIQMPKLNGLDAARRIRASSNARRATVPIIAMTANAFEEDKTKSLEAGMNAHLTKPVTASNLIETIALFV